MSQSLHSRPFGALPSGESVELWTLQGRGGLLVEAMTYGGIVTRLLVPGADDRTADVVLGFNRLEDYLAPHPFFGAMVGRVAGRTTGAAFSLDGHRYQLLANNGPNHLHGGAFGFDKKVWLAQPVPRADGAPSLRLNLQSPAGDQGYPGAVEVSVTYTVTPENVFLLETTAASDQPTPLAMTHHSYFNLAGEDSGPVEGHTLEIFSDAFIPADEHMTLLGRLEPVEGSPNDFRKPTRTMEAIPHLFQRHGSMYRLRADSPAALVPAARLAHPASGRVMEVATNEPYLQFYTGAFLDGSLRGKSGTPYPAHAGVCLECQGYPDAVNAPSMDDIILRPGSPRHRTTAYSFSVSGPGER